MHIIKTAAIDLHNSVGENYSKRDYEYCILSDFKDNMWQCKLKKVNISEIMNFKHTVWKKDTYILLKKITWNYFCAYFSTKAMAILYLILNQ